MKTCAVCFALVIAVVVVHAQSLSNDQINEAIALGKAKKNAMFIAGNSGNFSVGFSGPFARVVFAARVASEKYLPFSRADVADELLIDAITVTAYPHKPTFIAYSGWSVPPPATHLVLQVKVPKGQTAPDAVQPTKVDTSPVSWSNAVGGQFESQSITAFFDPSSIPQTDFSVVIITPRGEERCDVSAKERAKIR